MSQWVIITNWERVTLVRVLFQHFSFVNSCGFVSSAPSPFSDVFKFLDEVFRFHNINGEVKIFVLSKDTSFGGKCKRNVRIR